MKTLPTCSEWLRSNGCLFGCVSRSTMAPTPPLPVTEDTPPDMLAGSMDLQVVLPNGKSVKMSVERSTPMMDLLVQVATINRIPPGGHVIQAIGEKGILPYKPSTPIGALDTWTIEIVPKSKLNNAIAKKAPLKPNNQQPFEQTFRLQVHLPRNQLFVTRVSSKTSLADILTHVCMEKNLDASKYELRHPANLEERLSLECSLADYKLQEVVVVARSSRPVTDVADIMALQKEEEKRRQQAKAAGGNRFFGSVFRRNHSNMGEGSISSDSLGGRSSSPARSDESASRSASPPTNSLPSLVQLPVRPQRKRRPAPKPPVLTENNMQTLKENEEKNLQNCSNNKFEKGTTLISHSRNSSDSSGYHEASVLSESPDSHTAAQINSATDALHRRSKLTSSNHSPNQKTSDPPFFSRSLSNLATVGQYEPNVQSSMKKTSHSASTSVLSTAGQYKKKKAAPPPPPSRLKKAIPEQVSPDAHNSVQCDDEERLKTSSLDRHSRTTSKDDSGIDLDRSATLPAIVKRSKFENMGSNASSEESVAKISMRSFSSNEGDIDEEEEETVVPETKSQTVRDYNHCPVVAEPEIQSRQSDPVVKAPVCLPPDVIPIVAPQPADAVDKLEDAKVFPSPKPRTVFKDVAEQIPKPVPLPRKTLQKPADLNSNNSTSENFGSQHVEVEHDTLLPNKRNKLFDTFGLETLPPNSSRKKWNTNFQNELILNATNIGTTEDEAMSITSSTYGCDDSELDVSEQESSVPFNNKTGAIKKIPFSDTKLAGLRGSLNRGNSSVYKKQHTSDSGSVTSLRSLDEVPNFLSGGSNMGRWNNSEALHAISDENKQTPKWILGTDDSDTETDTIDTVETLTAFDKVINEIQYLPREDNQGRYMNDNSEVLPKNMKNMTSASLPLPVTIIPNDSKEENEDSLSIDWQYQLPAPPSAFRDTSANSPTLLEGETVVLADAEVFQENNSSLQSDVSSSSLEAPNVPEILEHKFAKSIESAVRAKDQEVLPVRISENEISRVNPLFNLHEYDNNSQRYSSGDEEKSSSGLGEDLHETCSYRKEVTEREEMRRREMSDSQRLVTNQPSYSNDNILSNFKLTTYEKPNEFDSIYHENETEFKDTSINIPAEVFKRPSLSAKAHDSKYSSTSSLHKASVVRVDSFEKSDSKPTVKRSTSYISLQNTSKLSNHIPKTSCIPGRAQSVTNLAFEHSSSEDDSLESSYRRYSEPNDEYNHSQVSSNQSQLSKLQSEFFHFQHKLQQSQSAFNQPDVQLQSLQVLRTILPQISQTKDQIEVPNTENKVDTASTTPSNKKEEMSDNTESQPKSVKNDSVVEEKRYRYQGPPSIKLSSWNERPKMQVNIKADSDYRFGGGKEESKSMNSQVQSKAEDKSIISSIKNHLYKPGNIISTKVDNNNSLSNLRSADSARSVARDVVLEPIASHKTESNNVMNQPLIVSSIPKDPVTSIHIGSYASNNYNSSQVADPSRVPIVRAVELKKPLQRQATDPVISFINGSVVKSEDFSNNQLSNKKTDSKPGGFVGVNSLAKKFSIGVSLQNNNNSSRSFNSRPVSSYELSAKPKFDNSEVQDDNNRFHSQDNKKVLTRSSSTNLINAPSVTINSYDNNNSVRNKYTSVVGVNRTGLSSTSFREQSAVTNGSVKPLSTFVKVGNFSSSRQPMPVVKGFQIPLQPSNAPSVSVKIQHQPPVTEPDSSRKSILQKAELLEERSSIHASNGKATHPFGNQANVSSSIVKIQHHSPNNQQPLKLHKSKSLDQECVVPVPPPAPAFSNVALKKSSHPRPKSMPVLCADPRDQLMEAIRAHGGMGNLKKVRRYDSSTPNVILRL